MLQLNIYVAISIFFFLFFQMFKTIYLKLDSILHRLQALLVCYQFQLDWSHASRVKTIQGGYCIYLFSSYHVYDVLQFPLFLADIIKVKNLFSFLHYLTLTITISLTTFKQAFCNLLFEKHLQTLVSMSHIYFHLNRLTSRINI